MGKVYTILDRCMPNWRKEFMRKSDCEEWIMGGLFECEGAERDHYVNMLREFKSGKTTLHYN